MASRPLSFVSPWLILYVTAVLASNLPGEVSPFIPSCAEECLLSFLNVNYASTGCAGTLTLDCMCSRIGATGFTLGEGAMQCISAERSIGYCSEVDASDEVIESAYNICNGRLHAIRPTHATITATLVIAPSGGVVTFPPVKTKTTLRRTTSTPSTTSSTTMTLPTTLVIDTSEPPEIPIKTRTTTTRTTRRSLTEDPDSAISATSSIPISDTPPTATEPTTLETSASTTETAASTSTEGLAGAGNDDEKKDSDKLSDKQIAGISVGVLAAAGVAAGAIMLARYYRRKNFPKVKTGFLPMRDTWGYKPDQSGSSSGGHNSWMAHQVHPNLEAGAPPPPAPAYNRQSYKPHTIGLTMSPPPSSRGTVHSSPLRRMSKLLPAKPVLPTLPLMLNREKSPPLLQPEWEDNERHNERHNTGPSSREDVSQLPPLRLASPPKVASPPRTKPMPPAPPKLQIPMSYKPPGAPSMINNRESNVTEFEEDRSSLSPNTQVWRPPTTPSSSTTYYVADQYGNWVLGTSKRGSLIVQSAGGSQGSQEVPPIPPPKDDRPAPTTAAVQAKTQALAPPAEIIPASSQPNDRPAGPRPQFPSPFFSSQSHPRRSSSKRRSMTRNLTRPREDSISSTTTITTSSESSSGVPSMSQEQQASLSPVAESPHSGHGRSPQPRIPPRDPRRMSQMTIRGENVNTTTGPPLARQIFYNPPGQPSPTLGMMQGPAASNTAPQQRPRDTTQPIQNAGLDKTGSPTMRIVEPSPSPEDPRPADPSQIRSSPFYFDPPYPQPLNTRQSSQQQRRSASGPQPQAYRPYQPPPSHQPSPQQQQQQQQQTPWQPAQRQPQSYQSFQQQGPMQPFQRQPFQQQPQAYQPFQRRPAPQQPYPRQQYQSWEQQYRPAQQQQQHSQIHPTRGPPYQSYRPSPTMNNISSATPFSAYPSSANPSSAHPDQGNSSLLAKRLGNDRAADMALGTEAPRSSPWQRDGEQQQQQTPPGFPVSAHWKPVLTPTRRG